VEPLLGIQPSGRGRLHSMEGIPKVRTGKRIYERGLHVFSAVAVIEDETLLKVLLRVVILPRVLGIENVILALRVKENRIVDYAELIRQPRGCLFSSPDDLINEGIRPKDLVQQNLRV